jgi:hypothetical protein
MRRVPSLCAALLAAAWSMPGAAQVASASSQASSMAGKMMAAGAAIGTLVLVVAGYFFMAGHGDRQSLALWLAGLAVVLCAPFIAGLLT